MADSPLSPSPSCPQPPDVRLSYGPMIIGVFLNMILYGVLIGQTYSYYQIYKRDVTWIKCLVFYLFVVETMNTCFDMAVMFQPLILEYGHPLGAFPTVFPAQPITVVAVSTPIQLFFAWRIHVLTKQKMIVFIIIILSLVSFGGGLCTTILIPIVKFFRNKPRLHWSGLVWLLAACIADVTITVTLVVNLSRRKTGFAATDDAISKIIRVTVQTGMLTALFALGDIILFLAVPGALNFTLDLALTKLYANCLMSTLNARASIREASSNRAHQLQNVSKISFTQTPVRNLAEPKASIHGQSSMFDHTTLHEGIERPSPRDDIELGVTVTKVVETMPEKTKI